MPTEPRPRLERHETPAAQALDFREFKPGRGTAKAKEVIRRYVKFLDIDRPLYPDHTRMKGQYLEVAKLLVEKGADVGARTRGGLTPLDMLKSRNSGERQRIYDFLRVAAPRK